MAKASQSLPSSQPPAGATAAGSGEVRDPGCKAKPRKGRPLCPRPASAAASCDCPSRGACSASGHPRPPARRTACQAVPAAGAPGVRFGQAGRALGARSQGLPTPSGVPGEGFRNTTPSPTAYTCPPVPSGSRPLGGSRPRPPASASLSPFPLSSLQGNKGAFYKADCWRLRRRG